MIMARIEALCIDGATTEEICTCCMLESDTVDYWIAHFNLRDLAPLRQTPQEAQRMAERKAEKVARFKSAMTAKANSAALGGFELAEAAIAGGRPRDFKDAAAGIATMAAIAKDAAGEGSGMGKDGALTLNLYVARVGERVHEPSAAIPVATSPVQEEYAFE